MRITIKGNEFYQFIGKNGGVPKDPKKQIFQGKQPYCSECLTTHEENKHVKEVK